MTDLPSPATSTKDILPTPVPEDRDLDKDMLDMLAQLEDALYLSAHGILVHLDKELHQLTHSNPPDSTTSASSEGNSQDTSSTSSGQGEGKVDSDSKEANVPTGACANTDPSINTSASTHSSAGTCTTMGTSIPATIDTITNASAKSERLAKLQKFFREHAEEIAKLRVRYQEVCVWFVHVLVCMCVIHTHTCFLLILTYTHALRMHTHNHTPYSSYRSTTQATHAYTTIGDGDPAL